MSVTPDTSGFINQSHCAETQYHVQCWEWNLFWPLEFSKWLGDHEWKIHRRWTCHEPRFRLQSAVFRHFFLFCGLRGNVLGDMFFCFVSFCFFICNSIRWPLENKLHHAIICQFIHKLNTMVSSSYQRCLPQNAMISEGAGLPPTPMAHKSSHNERVRPTAALGNPSKRRSRSGSGAVPPHSPVPSAWDAESRLRSALLLVKWRKLIELYSSHEGNCFWVNGCFQQWGRQAERHKQALSWRDKLTQSPRLQIATIKYIRRRRTNNITAHCGPTAAPLSGWVIIFNERPRAKRNRSKPPYHK